MDSIDDIEFRAMQEFFILELQQRGGAAGNGALREALGWSDAAYDRVKQALLQAGQILPGRGRGGSVRLAEGVAVTPDLPLPFPAAPPPAAPGPPAELPEEPVEFGSLWDGPAVAPEPPAPPPSGRSLLDRFRERLPRLPGR